MTFTDYQAAVRGYRAWNPQQRSGQAHFNALYLIWPKLANEINGSNLDPYHDDARLPEFLHFVKSRFGTPAAAEATDRFVAKPGWVVVGPRSGMPYGVGKGRSFAEAAAFGRKFVLGGHLRLATRDELSARQAFIDRVKVELVTRGSQRR